MKSYLDYDWLQVINFESGGEKYYNKYLKNITWPGGYSGLTFGIGIDLGYIFLKQYFEARNYILLTSLLGIKGDKAKASLYKVKTVGVKWEDAIEIFKNFTLPKFWKLANELWPGMDLLCESAQVALVSLVFNRGCSIQGDSRKEMKNIIDLVKNKDYYGISSQIKSMKRLWVNKNQDGLLKRRDIESEMVLRCLGDK